jgi:pimeloyl-ACP methyl ester carboxylesterase
MVVAFSILMGLCSPSPVTAAEISGFVQVTKEQSLFVVDSRGKGEALIFLNGLTYSTKEWGSLTDAINELDPSLRTIRYDMTGMGKTLLKDPLPVNYAISLERQVNELKGLMDSLGLKKATLVGLSYGGGVGLEFARTYPNRVARLILMAPFTEALASQDEWILRQIAGTRIAFPLNPATDDELYDFFLRKLIFTTYPSAEPIVMENPYKLESVFRMVQGIRRFEARKIVRQLPSASVHLVVADQDQYLKSSVMDEFWTNLPKRVKASRIDISFTEHKIPEAIPLFAAGWIYSILKNPTVSGGKEFHGNTITFRAWNEDERFELPRGR